MRIRQFEIWIAYLNPQIGTEAGKIRPVVVVQTDLLNKVHPSTLVCPITTKVQAGSDILRVHIEKGTCGVENNCDIMLDQVRAIDNRRLVKKTGQLTASLIDKIKFNFLVIFDLD
jgi:mRNA interferase MazF